jgi:arsenite methyltransferase
MARSISADIDIDKYRYVAQDAAPNHPTSSNGELTVTIDSIAPSTALDALTEEVRDKYARAALAVTDRAPARADASCCGPNGNAVFGEILYDAGDRASLPDAAVLASLGCGNPTAVAELRPGEVVLDLGSGGGIDVLLSAQRVGPTGFAHGLDMTDEMLDLARRNAAEAGVENVAFHQGRIEAIPLPDASIDVVISNCVVNLSSDKSAVLAEVARVLKPGGRIGISDVVADDALTPPERAERGSFVGCIAGALSFDEYRRGLDAVGLVDVRVTATHAVGDGLHGAIVQAVKPLDWSADRIRSVDLPRPSLETLPVVAEGSGCCGDGCGCS